MGRIILIVVGLPLLYFGAIVLASEMGGEVVKVETQSEDGRRFETSLWIVDFDRGAWLRSGDGESDWLFRIRANPEVFVTREGVRSAYRARVIDGLVQRVNDEMRVKYGAADRLIATLHDPENVVAIRLDQR